jgi:hypothetical protein
MDEWFVEPSSTGIDHEHPRSTQQVVPLETLLKYITGSISYQATIIEFSTL